MEPRQSCFVFKKIDFSAKIFFFLNIRLLNIWNRTRLGELPQTSGMVLWAWAPICHLEKNEAQVHKRVFTWKKHLEQHHVGKLNW